MMCVTAVSLKSNKPTCPVGNNGPFMFFLHTLGVQEWVIGVCQACRVEGL